MKARQFNRQFPVGSVMKYTPAGAAQNGKTVKLVDIARDFKCGTVVEINSEPFFVKTDSLKANK